MATAPPDADTMVSFPTLDLLLLTFNCGKAPIHVPVFAAHLQRALSDHAVSTNASSLPDLVVFSLQEVAPLGHAFVGSYFLNPYFSRFDEALTLAAAQVDGYRFDGSASYNEDADDGADQSAGQRGPGGSWGENAEQAQSQTQVQGQARPFRGYKKHYHLVRQAHVGMTAILLFARDPSAVQAVQVAHCGFGVADMGNKGAVGLRIAYGNTDGGENGRGASTPSPSELTFVATHLAAMEWNVRRRNANWRSIVAGLTFGNPKDVITAAAVTSEAAAALGRGPLGRSHDEAASAPRTPEEEAEAEAADAAGDDAWLLLGDQQHEIDVRRHLHDLSVYRPDSLLFVAGDLNYRIGDQRPPADADLPTASTWHEFFKRDQLTEERLAGRTLHGLKEAPIDFPPTYKYDVLSAEEVASGVVPANADEIRQWQAAQLEIQRNSAEEADASGDSSNQPSHAPVPWKYANHRWPSWCDRVLYLDVPEWTKKSWSSSSNGGEAEAVPEVRVTAYKPLPLMRTSDHQAVYLRARVPLLGKTPGRPEEEAAAEETGAGPVDPRLRLPVAIDTDAWARRARARNRERLAGGGMLLFNTRTGAVAMATTVVVVVALYWVWVGLM